MQQLSITGSRQAEFVDIATPRYDAGQLLVQAELTAISQGTELRVYRAQPVDEAGLFLHENVPFELPCENGYSMVGRVLEVGADATGFAVGDRVFVPAAHKQVAVIDAAMAVPLPDAIPNEHAVFLNIIEVAHIALRRSRMEPGWTVAVIGQGVIGLSALALCRAFGCRTIAVDIDESRLSLSRRMGSDLTIGPRNGDFEQQVMDFSDGAGVDLVVEAASSWEAIRTGMQIARTDGRIVAVSRHLHAPQFNPLGRPYLGMRLELVTSYGYPPQGSRFDRNGSIALTLQLLADGRLDIAPMITHRLSWDELPSAYARLDAGEQGMAGVVLKWT